MCRSENIGFVMCWKQAADNRTLKTVPYKITKITSPRETSAPTAGWLCIIYFRQYRIILSADTASEVRQLPERCLSRKAGIVRCCLYIGTKRHSVRFSITASAR